MSLNPISSQSLTVFIYLFWVVIVICLLCCASRSCVLGLVLTSFHLLLSYATWLCVFGFLCLRFGFWIFYDSLFIYLCSL